MTSLREKPSCECEVTIRLSRDVVTDIKEPGSGVEGVYRSNGSYCMGRPVLQHSGGLLTLSVWDHWGVSAGVKGEYSAGHVSILGHEEYLWSRSAPSLCPADTRAPRDESWGETHWRYRNKQEDWEESNGISVKCSNCVQ